MSKTTTNSPRADVYSRVTARILEDLEKGVRPWMKPWSASHAEGRAIQPLRHNGQPYSGINVLLLWGDAIEKGFTASTWMTFRQAEAFGAHVRKGEHGSMVVYADRYAKTEANEKGEEVERQIPFMKAYTVFNVEQIEGLPDRFAPVPLQPRAPLQLMAEAERFFSATGAVIRHGGNRAFYAPSQDVIQLPPSDAFRDAESYAATKAHELVHWTGHESRNARAFGKRFADQAYAFEELVAELGAAFLCAELAVTMEPREDHAAYLASWLDVLKQDKRAIFSAASHAQRAVDYLRALQPSPMALAA